MLLTATFFGLSISDPRLQLGWFALVAVIGAFASATQDIVIDAWRIDVADAEAPVEILSSVYQFGYRIAALIGGALALVLSERVGWPKVYAIMGGFMALTIVATLFAPDTPRTEDEIEQTALRGRRHQPEMARHRPCYRRRSAGPGRSSPSAAFMVRIVTRLDPAIPIRPWSAISPEQRGRSSSLQLVLPAIVAAVFNWRRQRGATCAGSRPAVA